VVVEEVVDGEFEHHRGRVSQPHRDRKRGTMDPEALGRSRSSTPYSNHVHSSNAIALANSPQFVGRNRHLEIRQRWINERLQQ
jgi:hypothetical protein